MEIERSKSYDQVCILTARNKGSLLKMEIESLCRISSSTARCRRNKGSLLKMEIESSVEAPNTFSAGIETKGVS